MRESEMPKFPIPTCPKTPARTDGLCGGMADREIPALRAQRLDVAPISRLLWSKPLRCGAGKTRNLMLVSLSVTINNMKFMTVLRY